MSKGWITLLICLGAALYTLELIQARMYTENLLRKAHLSYFPYGIKKLKMAMLDGFQCTKCLPVNPFAVVDRCWYSARNIDTKLNLP